MLRDSVQPDGVAVPHKVNGNRSGAVRNLVNDAIEVIRVEKSGVTTAVAVVLKNCCIVWIDC